MIRTADVGAVNSSSRYIRLLGLGMLLCCTACKHKQRASQYTNQAPEITIPSDTLRQQIKMETDKAADTLLDIATQQ